MIRRVYVRKDGSKSVRYMFQAYGGKQTPLGTDYESAAKVSENKYLGAMQQLFSEKCGVDLKRILGELLT